MKTNRKYLIAVALLTVLALAFGVFGTVAPPLPEESTPVQPQQESSSGSVGHFQNPPTYDSGWVDIKNKTGQYFNITHNLDTTEVFIDIMGRQSLSATGEHKRNFGGVTIPGWDRAYGSSNNEEAYCVIQTIDGGYALSSKLYYNGSVGEDAWLVKTDSSGNMRWNKTYGGEGIQTARSVIQASDGGLVFVGGTSVNTTGIGDAWLVKTDPAGNMQWNKTYGGIGDEDAFSVIQTVGGGYAFAGFTDSYSAGSLDFWLVVTDSTGNLLLNKTYGRTISEYAVSMVQTSDGGYAMAGITGGFPNIDFWLVRTDSAGNALWNRTYGRMYYDRVSSLIQTSDDGYALAGRSSRLPAPAPFDALLVKTDSSGNMQWNKTYGGMGSQDARSLLQASDGGYVVTGFINPSSADSDAWLVKTDAAGNTLWNQTYGGAADAAEFANSIIQSSNGGYVLAGSRGLYNSAHGDVWMVKTDADQGLAWTDSTDKTITLYRGKTDPYWNFIRVRAWTIQEPTWIYGDINIDGIVDGKDLYILGRNYGKTFSLLSLGGIIAVASVHTVKKRKQTKQPSKIK